MDEDRVIAHVVGVNSFNCEIVRTPLVRCGEPETYHSDSPPTGAQDTLAICQSVSALEFPTVDRPVRVIFGVVSTDPSPNHKSESWSSWTNTCSTRLAACSPVSGSVATTLSPTRTSSIDFREPSAINTTVLALKEQAVAAVLAPFSIFDKPLSAVPPSRRPWQCRR